MTIHLKGEPHIGDEIHHFMKHHGLHAILGFSGGADSGLTGYDENDEVQTIYKDYTQHLHTKIVDECLAKLRGYRLAILTGGTQGGVPEIATKVAKKYGFSTIGVFPERGKKYSLPDKYLDLKICVHPFLNESQWGDEGSIWTSLVDGVVVIGGGAGTLTECAHIQKLNEARLSNNTPPKFIVPIHGTGGIAEQLPHLWAKPSVKSFSMPNERVYTGGQAASLLIDNINFDYFENFNHLQEITI